MHSRRPFLIASLADAEEAMFNQFLKARDDGFPSPLKFFKPAYGAHVSKWGEPLEERPNALIRAVNDAWIKESRNYPLFQERQQNKKINYLPITEQAFDGSDSKFWEADELTQWRPLWTYSKIDLSLCIKRLLKMDTLFDEDYKKLLEWLKTRGKPFYLTGGEYYNLTNPRAFRHGVFGKAHKYLEMISASFKTY